MWMARPPTWPRPRRRPPSVPPASNRSTRTKACSGRRPRTAGALQPAILRPMALRTRAFETLASDLDGRLVTPGDDDYDAQRQVFLGDFDKRPAAIARVANADDVARVIGFARDTGVELAIRCGGHSATGQSTTDGGLVLDLRDLRTIDIDPEARTVWAGAGLSAGRPPQGAARPRRAGGVRGAPPARGLGRTPRRGAAALG